MSRSVESPAADKKKTTLRNEILGGAFVIPLTLLVALGAITYFLARDATLDQSRRSLETVAKIQEDRIEAYVESGSSSFALITARTRTKTAIDDYQLTRNPHLRAEAVRNLYDGVAATPDFTSVTVFDRELRPLMYAGTVESQPWIPADFLVAAAERLTRSRVVDTAGGSPVNLVGGPMLLDGELVGIAVAGQSLQALYELANDTTGLGDTGQTIIAGEVNGAVMPISPATVDGLGTGTGDGGMLGDQLLESVVSGRESWTPETIDFQGEAVVAFFRHIDGTDWGMTVLQSSEEMLAPLNIYTRVIGSAILVGLLIAFLAARRVADSVTAPLVRMAENARKVAQGRRDVTVETNLEEIAHLVEAFNSMISELDDLTDELEQKIEDRTHELTEANARLRRVMDDKEVFLAGVSHELRSPLTAMIGFIDLVTSAGDSLANEERSEMLETISSQATEVLNLIEDLLASARAEAGTLKMASVRVDLAAQARQVIETINPSSHSTVEFSGGSGHAWGDPARVRQIVRNLITNAIRYGGSTIEVEVDTTGDVVVLEVRDDGDGILEEDREKIFEAYGQAEGSRQVSGSVGLGLHVSRSLARLMGGDLDYDHMDEWSVFSLRLLRFTEKDDASTTDDSSLIVSLGSTE